jgi:anti-sigma B factor antagonist
MIQFTCTHCQTRLSVSDDKAGHSGKCPKCGRTIQVPSAAAAKGVAPLMPKAGAGERSDAGDIPLMDEPPRVGSSVAARQPQPFRAAVGPAVTPANSRERIERAEIPLAEERGKTEKETPLEPAAPPTAGGLVVTPAGDATVVSFHNSRILDALAIETIGQELYALVDERGCRKIVLDFSNVDFLSSQMLGVLMALQKKATAIRGRVLLCAVHNDLKKVFQIVKLERVLPIVADRHTALGVLSLP